MAAPRPCQDGAYGPGLVLHRASAALRARAARCPGLRRFQRACTAFRAAALRSAAVSRFARVLPPWAPHARNRTFARSSDSCRALTDRAGLTQIERAGWFN